jgi:hypothetical protein
MGNLRLPVKEKTPSKRENSQKTAPKTPKTERNYTPEPPKNRMKSIR